MNPYTLVLFLHVFGAVGLFAAYAIEAASLAWARRGGGDPRAPLRMLPAARRLGMGSMLLVLGSGGWMMATVWGHQPWIEEGGAGLIAMGVAGFLSLRRLRPVERALTGGADPGPALGAALQGRFLATLLWQRAAIGVAVLALMTVRPDPAVGWAMLAAGALAGLAGGLLSRAPGQEPGSQPLFGPAPAGDSQEIAGGR